jgi:hypothetical protein
MQRLTLAFFLLITLVFVTTSSAAVTAGPLDVVINEVAWMGTTVSTMDKWIELYNNTSDAIDLSGWTLSATDGRPCISWACQRHGKTHRLFTRWRCATLPSGHRGITQIPPEGHYRFAPSARALMPWSILPSMTMLTGAKKP